MRKTLYATVAVIAVAAAVPLVASAGGGWRWHGGNGDGHGMRGDRHGWDGGHGRHGGWHDDRRARMRFQDMLATYDADGDGSIGQAEVDQVRAARLGEFDADKNGQLSLEEYQALWLDAMHERMVDRFQAHDDDGDGQVTVAEFGERTSRMVMRRDRNEDGALNLDDFAGRHGPRGMGEPETGPDPEDSQQQ